MYDKILNPEALVPSIKKNNSLGTAFGVLLLSVGLFFVSALILINKLGYGLIGWDNIIVGLLGLAVLGVIGSAIFAKLLKIGLNIMGGGKGRFTDSLTAISFSSLASAKGLFIGVLLSYIPSISVIPIGAILAGIVFAFFLTVSISLFYRLLKDLFSVDSVVVLVGTIFIMYAALTGLYFFIYVQLLSVDNLLNIFLQQAAGGSPFSPYTQGSPFG